MKNEAVDQPVLKAIQQLAAEEHRLYAHAVLGPVAAAPGFAGCWT
jgi:hypothetical protein